MPKILYYRGYIIYFWSNENGEPVHVHIGKRQEPTSTKVWLTSTGGVLRAHNKGRIPLKDLRKIEDYLVSKHSYICHAWTNYFGRSVHFYR